MTVGIISFSLQVISVMKRKWGQHRLMHGHGHSGRNSTMYTHTTMTVTDTNSIIPPKSPTRLYENRNQSSVGKAAKSNNSVKPVKMRAEYVSLEQKPSSEWNNSSV